MLFQGYLIFRIGLVLMALAIVITVVTLTVRMTAQKKLSAQLDREYGTQQRKKGE